MEAAALFALGGLGYLVSRLTSNKEPFQDTPYSNEGEASLEEQYNTLTGVKPPPSEPVKEKQQGLMSSYPAVATPVGALEPAPEPLDSSSPSVALNPSGFEVKPTYIENDYITSELTGTQMKAGEFTHNNMTPFFGGRVKQNMAPDTNSGILNNFTGSGINQIKKREVETMFDTANTPYGTPFGLESSTDFIQSRINDPKSRAGERPFEPTRVAPALNEGFGIAGKGGFQQYEVNQYMIDNLKRTDDLRTSDNPKLTYNQPVVPGQHFIGGAAQDAGEVRKYRPDRFYIDESGERFFVTTGDVVKEATRPVQVMKHTSRPETSAEIFGTAASQEYGQSYVTGSYRTPMVQQYGGAGFRNADMTSYTTGNTDAAENDYGRSAIEMRPNERNVTGERVMGLNLVPADSGNVTIHYTDPARPTRRSEAEGSIRQTGTPVGYAGGAPAITVWDPNDTARTTIREGTIKWDYMGISASASAPNKLKVYDPEDIAKPTQKSQISAKSDYFGTPNATNKDFTSHDAAYNMRTNPVNEQIAKGRSPIHGNGGSLAVFDGNIHQTTRRLDGDYVNDRSNAVNRVVSIPSGVGDIGQVKYRVPLKMDVSQQRNSREILSGIHSNPLMASQDLTRNATGDDLLYEDFLKGI